MNNSLSSVKAAYRLFSNPLASKNTVRHNVKSYLRAISILGDRWILASQVIRKATK